MTNINTLITLGGKRWTKENHDRIYFTGEQLAKFITEQKGTNLSKKEIQNLHDANFYYNVMTSEYVWKGNRDSNFYSNTIIAFLSEAAKPAPVETSTALEAESIEIEPTSMASTVSSFADSLENATDEQLDRHERINSYPKRRRDGALYLDPKTQTWDD